MQLNIFSSLITYSPRPDRTQKENFLTEAFAFVLRTSGSARKAWAADVLGVDRGDVEVNPEDIDTQRGLPGSGRESGRGPQPDMILTGRLASGGSFAIVHEHKWDSSVDTDQLKRYVECGAGLASTVLVVLITPRPWDRAVGLPAEVRFQLWEDVHRVLRDGVELTDMVQQFIDFLSVQGLSSQVPLSVVELAAYRYVRRVEDGFTAITNALLGKEWDFLPVAFSGSKKAIHGMTQYRIGVQFDPYRNRPYLYAGFLLDPYPSHADTSFSSPRGPDLILGLDAQPDVTIQGSALSDLAGRLESEQPELTILTQENAKLRGQWEWRKLLVCKPVADVVSGHTSLQDQADVAYTELRKWCRVLFDGEALQRAFVTTWPDLWRY